MPSRFESGRAKYTYSKMQACRDVSAKGRVLFRPLRSMITISPGSTSRV
jgi:hypothetical protein